MHYEVNTLAPLLLMRQLALSLKRAEAPVVVNTSTDPVASAKKIDFETLHRPTKIVKLFGSYVVSKVAVAAAMEAVARAPGWSNVRIYNVAPGAIKTAMTGSEGMPFWLKPIRNLLFKSPAQGAARLYDAAFSSPTESPALLIGGKVRPMPLRVERIDFDRIVAGLKAREAFVHEIFSGKTAPVDE